MQRRQIFFHKSAQKYNKEKKIFLKVPRNATKIFYDLPKNALKYKKYIYIYIQKSRSTYLTNYIKVPRNTIKTKKIFLKVPKNETKIKQIS